MRALVVLVSLAASGCAAQARVGGRAEAGASSEELAGVPKAESARAHNGVRTLSSPTPSMSARAGANAAGAPNGAQPGQRTDSGSGSPEQPLAGLDEPGAGSATSLGWVLHRLGLAADRAAHPACGCVAAAAGPATDPAFVWSSGAEPPDRGIPTGALVIAIAGAGCPSASRPSIAAISRTGHDVVVEIENQRAGAPVVSGVVLDPPAAGGGVLLRARPGLAMQALGADPSGCRIAGQPTLSPPPAPR